MDDDLLLRHLREDDLPALFEQQLDPVACRMAAFQPRDRAAFDAHWARVLADRTVTSLTAVVGGRVAGYAVAFRRDGLPLVGYWIGREHWGRGIATRALAGLLAVVAERPIHAHVARHNVASLRVLEKCGFRLSPAHTAALAAPADGIEEVVLVLGG